MGTDGELLVEVICIESLDGFRMLVAVLELCLCLRVVFGCVAEVEPIGNLHQGEGRSGSLSVVGAWERIAGVGRFVG